MKNEKNYGLKLKKLDGKSEVRIFRSSQMESFGWFLRKQKNLIKWPKQKELSSPTEMWEFFNCKNLTKI
jgi:hypothetical protein